MKVKISLPATFTLRADTCTPVTLNQILILQASTVHYFGLIL